MGKLSDLVMRDYDEEVKIIKEAGGRLWPKLIGVGGLAAAMWGWDQFFGTPWRKRDALFLLIFVIAGSFVVRAWERHKVAAEMRHQREVRVEVKLDALLGLVNIKDDE